MDYDMERSGFFSELRQLTNMTNATTKEMYDATNYIYWTRMSNRTLMFELNEK